MSQMFGDAFTSIHWRALVCTWRHTIGSDLEKRSASRRLSQEICSSTRDEGASEGTPAGGGYPAIANGSNAAMDFDRSGVQELGTY